MSFKTRAVVSGVAVVCWGLLPVLAAGCATEKQAWPASAPTRHVAFDPDELAAQYLRAADCESAARSLLPESRNQAWGLLKACVRRGNFLLLRQLASPAWVRELQTRSDAASLLAQVIAMRGGSIPLDLQVLHEQRVPLFSLADGLSQPETYAGRYIVLRAKVEELRAEGGNITARLSEYGLRSTRSDAQVGPSSHHLAESSGSGHLQGSATFGSGGARGGYSTSTDHSRYNTVRKYDNVSDETGRGALARLPAPDPFLEPGHEFIILARFDGVRESSNGDDENPEQMPVLTLITYFEPSALVVY